MRDIKFRGKSINGDWYYGLLSESKGYKSQPEKGLYISNQCGMPWAYQVRPETVGQFTGLTDKNGKEIYEGDILKLISNSGYAYHKPLAVEYCEQWCQFVVADNDIKQQFGIWSDFDEFEIIRNIYENKELLEGIK